MQTFKMRMRGAALATASDFGTRWIRIVGCVACVFALLEAGESSATSEGRAGPDVWLVPFSNYIAPGDKRHGPTDFLRLFDAPETWANTAKSVKVFKVYFQQVMEMPDQDLVKLLRGLEALHIDIAMEGPILSETDRCGADARPGLGPMPGISKVKRLGGKVKYYTMNEPLSASPGAMDGCRRPLDAIAVDAARNIQKMKAVFPEIMVGDVEAVGRQAHRVGWMEQFPVWIAAFEHASGSHLAFLHVDVDWLLPWQDDLRQLAAIARDGNIPLGIVIGGNYRELSDRQWARSSREHYEEIEALGINPDTFLFQSWGSFPTRTVPESDPLTATGILHDFLRSRLALVMTSPTTARLTNMSGAPIQGAVIELQDNTSSPDRGLRVDVVDGIVPEGARNGLFIIRMHAECTCSGMPVEATLANLNYAEGPESDALSVVAAQNLQAWTHTAAGAAGQLVATAGGRVHISLRSSDRIVLNGDRFPVTANARFEARLNWQVPLEARDAGFLGVVFLGADDREITRSFITMGPSWVGGERLVTNEDGVVTFERTAANAHRLFFAGNARFRPVSLIFK